MNQRSIIRKQSAAALLACALYPMISNAHSRVQYGRVIKLNAVTRSSSTARTVGKVIGGTIGLVGGSGQSNSNRALRGVGGGGAGRGVGSLPAVRRLSSTPC